MAPKKDTKKDDKLDKDGKKKVAPKPISPELKALMEKEKAIEKVAKPDKTGLDALEAKTKEETSGLEAKKEMLQKKITARTGGSDGFQKAKNELKSKLDEYSAAIDTLMKQKDALYGTMDATKAEGRAKKNELQDMKKKLGFESLEDVDGQIKKLEYEMSHSSLTIKEEKKRIDQIKVLKKMKPQVQKVMGMSAGVDEASITTSKASIGNIQEELKAARDAKKIQQDAYRKLMEEHKAVNGDVPALFEERNALNDQIRAKYTVLKAKKDEFYAANKLYNDYEWQVRQIRNDRGRIERDIRNAEWESKKNEEKEEEGPPPAPFAMDLLTLEQTMFYLKTLLPKEAVEVVVEKTEEAAGVLVQKKDRDDEFFFAPTKGPRSAKGKKGGKKAAATAAPKAKAIVHTMDSLSTFDKYKLTIPAKTDMVSDVIGEVEKKIAEFKKKQADKVAELERKAKLTPEEKAAEEPKEAAEEATA